MQGAGGLPLGGQQPVQVAVELLGQGERGQRLVHGRAVDDDGVPAGRLPGTPCGPGQRGPAQGAQQGELLGAGEFGEFLGVQRPRAQEGQEGLRGALEVRRPAAEVPAGVGAGRPQAGNPGDGGGR
ncbi:hypothetical protein GCM10010406_28730 [Streptomyces thermolineatus]|uniref:Uncharacterized protein n=1 Tax=Streptomyces thermolineatus TaxID=44033 RepID=A0ABN3LYH0_9ACTN